MSEDGHFDTPQDMWEYFFQEYNAQFWHDQEHGCYGVRDCPERPPPRKQTEGYAQVNRDIETSMDGSRIIREGTTVRINMVSRFGDLGITPNLEQENGYWARVAPTKEYLTNCRLKR